MFPQQHDERGMTCLALCKEFLVLGASSGEVTYFYLPEQCQVRLTYDLLTTYLLTYFEPGRSYVFLPA